MSISILKNLRNNTTQYQLNLILVVVCTLCCGITIWLWYPGIIHDDAMAQYMQALGEVPVSDWHPPLMVRLWQAEIYLFHTPKLLNPTYIALFSLGVYLITSSYLSWRSVFLCIVMFVFPACFLSNGWIYKDVLLSNLILIVCGLITRSTAKYGSITKGTKIISLLILISASFLRFNAIFAIAPLLVLLISNWKPTFLRLATSLGLVILFIGITPFVNHTLLKAKPDHAEVSLETFNLGGIAWEELKHPNQEAIFQHWDNASNKEKLAACYSPYQWDNYGVWVPKKLAYLHNSWDSRLFRVENIALGNLTDKTYKCQKIGYEYMKDPKVLKTLWLHTIREHPLFWLKHRWNHFSPLLGHYFPEPAHLHTFAIRVPGIYSLDWVHSQEVRHFPGDWTAFIALQWIRFPCHLLEWGSVWLTLAIITFIKTFKCKTHIHRIINCCAFASITYICGYFFVSVGDLFRYFLPAIYLIIVTVITTSTIQLKNYNTRL